MGIEIFRHRDDDARLTLVVERGHDVLMFRVVEDGAYSSVLVPVEKWRDLAAAVSALPGYEAVSEPPTAEPDAIRVTALGLALKGWTQEPYGDVVARAAEFEGYLRAGAGTGERVEAGPCSQCREAFHPHNSGVPCPVCGTACPESRPEPISPRIRAPFGMANAAVTEQPRLCDGCGHVAHGTAVCRAVLDYAGACACTEATDGGVPRTPVTDDVPKCAGCGHAKHGTVECRARTLTPSGAPCLCTGPGVQTCGTCGHSVHGTGTCWGYFQNGTVSCPCTGAQA